jgi:hypothetical protein
MSKYKHYEFQAIDGRLNRRAGGRAKVVPDPRWHHGNDLRHRLCLAHGDAGAPK